MPTGAIRKPSASSSQRGDGAAASPSIFNARAAHIRLSQKAATVSARCGAGSAYLPASAKAARQIGAIGLERGFEQAQRRRGRAGSRRSSSGSRKAASTARAAAASRISRGESPGRRSGITAWLARPVGAGAAASTSVGQHGGWRAVFGRDKGVRHMRCGPSGDDPALCSPLSMKLSSRTFQNR